jgi:hypothetical protein
MNSCAFCGGFSSSVSSWDSLIKAANQFIAEGVDGIEISGMDAGEYNRLVELVQYLTNQGIKGIFLATHGRTLKNEQFVENLKKAGVTLVKISLYGSTAEIHNKLTQVPLRKMIEGRDAGNSFIDTVEGIKNCAKYDIPVLGSIIATQYNKEDLNNIVKLFLDLTNDKICSIHIRTPFLIRESLDFTGEWFLPTKDMPVYMKEVYLHHPEIPSSTIFAINEIPYCVFGVNTPLVENGYYSYGGTETKSDGSNIGILQRNKKPEIANDIPFYREKTYFKECEGCVVKNKCIGVSSVEYRMFGMQGLKAIRSF